MRLLRLRGALVPHAPLLLPQVTTKTDDLRDLWEGLTRVQIPAGATVVVLTPHAATGVYARNEGSLAGFGLPEVTASFDRADIDLALDVSDDELDHGSLVPLMLLGIERPTVVVGAADATEVPTIVDRVRALAEEREIFVIASAHTSVRLTERAPLLYSFDAVRLETRFITGVETDCAAARDAADDLATIGGSCSRATLHAFGDLFAGAEGNVLAYASPFGVGYPVVTAEVDV